MQEFSARIPAEPTVSGASRTSRELLDILNILPTAVYVCDAEGRIESFNPSAAELWGREPRCGDQTELFCGSLRLFLADGSTFVPHAQCLMARVLRTGRPETNQEIVIERPDGSRRTAMVNIVPRRDPGGRITGAINCMTDITARKQAKETLRERESRIRRLVDSNIIGVVFWDAAGDIGDANQAFLTMVGHSHAALSAGQLNWHRMVTPHSKEDARRAHAELSCKGSCTPYEQELVRKDGSLIPVLVGSTTFEGAHGEGISFVLDLTERKRDEQRIRYLAHYDALTGLPNRALLQDRLQQEIAHANRLGNQVAVIFLDLDNFKHINDSHGHELGDHLLQTVSLRLRECLRDGDSVARLGGDEFVLTAPMVHGSKDAALIAQKVLAALNQPIDIDDTRLQVGGSIGISLYPNDGLDVESLMRAADTAMYHAKECGRSNYQFFTAALSHAAHQRHNIENDLRQALALDELEVHYQPQVDIRSGRIVAAEALLRWRRPGKPPVSCGDFIAVAEQSGLIVPIGAWVLRQACQQLKRWQDAGASDLKVAVNLSARQFGQQDLLPMIRQTLDDTGLAPAALSLEITETGLMERNRENLATLKKLHAMGIHLAIDDFGTGYSSLAYLQRFPVQALKIDQSFVSGLESDAGDMALVRAIIAMARSMRLEILAEGVETSQQAATLLAHDCTVAQGFFYSPAVPAHTFARLLASSYPPVAPALD